MRVLLISPLDPQVPDNLKNLMGGENTYTKNLINYPPSGVIFFHYLEAIQKRQISYHPLYYLLLLLQKIRILPPGPRAIVIRLHTQFDLVYAHVHPLKISGKRLPIVISDSSSSSIFLKFYLRLPLLVYSFWKIIKYVVFSILGIIDCEVNTQKAQKIFVFSEWAKKIKLREFGIKNAEVLYPGIPDPGYKKLGKPENKKVRFLFIGTWFERKGGRILLEAFANLQKIYPQIELTIIGLIPPDISLQKYQGIRHHVFVPQKKIHSFYKTHEILVHVPSEVEGYGMVVPESMSYGMVPVVTNICALPEFVVNNKSGLTVDTGSQESLTQALQKLITDKKFRLRLHLGSVKKYKRQFRMNFFRKKLKYFFKLTT